MNSSIVIFDCPGPPKPSGAPVNMMVVGNAAPTFSAKEAPGTEAPREGNPAIKSYA
jgi:hypothetical protein